VVVVVLVVDVVVDVVVVDVDVDVVVVLVDVVGGSVVVDVLVVVVDVVVGAIVVVAACAVPSSSVPAHDVSRVAATSAATATQARRAGVSEEPPFPRANIASIMSSNHRPVPSIA